MVSPGAHWILALLLAPALVGSTPIAPLTVRATVHATTVRDAAAAAHPLHTTLIELTQHPRDRTVTASLRIFADDLQRATTPRRTPDDATVQSYAARHFVLADAARRNVAWSPCGVRRQGELVFVCLRAAPAATLAGAELRADVLTEVHADQVNVVRLVTPSVRRTLLFTRTDARQRLP